MKAEGELGAMQGPHCNHLPSPREAWRLLLPPRGVRRAVATFLGRALASHSSVLGPALLQSKPGSEKAWGGGGGRTPHSGLEPAVLRGLGTHPQGLASPPPPPPHTPLLLQDGPSGPSYQGCSGAPLAPKDPGCMSG